MEGRGLRAARAMAQRRKVPNWNTLQPATRKGKRFSIRSPAGRLISFGSWPVASGTFLDHQDEAKRRAWRARHQVRGDPHDRESALFYAWKILW